MIEFDTNIKIHWKEAKYIGITQENYLGQEPDGPSNPTPPPKPNCQHMFLKTISHQFTEIAQREE